MEKSLIFIAAILLFTSCQSLKKCNRATAKIERALELCPDIEKQYLDTFEVVVPEIRDSLIYEVDSIPYPVIVEAVDSAKEGNFDLITPYVNRPCLSDTITKETDEYKITFFPLGLGFDFRLQVKQDTIEVVKETRVITPPEYIERNRRWWEIPLFVLGGVFLILLILGTILKVKKSI